MNLKNLYRLEVWLLIFMAVLIMLSVTSHTEHSPHWTVLVVAGILAVFLVARPKIIGFSLIFIVFAAGLLSLGFDPIGDRLLDFAVVLSAEFWEWTRNPNNAGPSLVWIFSSASVFLIVSLQFFLILKAGNIVPLIVLGVIIYTLLWMYRFPDTELGLLLFLMLAFSAASFLYIRKHSKLDRIWYKTGIISLGLISALGVLILPWDLEPLEVEGGLNIFNNRYTAERLEPGKVGDAIPLSSTERITGYSPGGELGGSLTRSAETVLEIKLLEGSLPSSLYLRGQARDYYTGSSWKNKEAEPVDDLDAAFSCVHNYDSGLKVQVSYLKPEEDLFGLFPSTELEIVECNGNDDQENQGYQADSFGNIKADHSDFKGDYILSGKEITDLDLQNIEPKSELEKDSDQLLAFLQVPGELPERVEELAREIVVDADEELEKANQIMGYLRQFPYSRGTPNLPPGDDFVDHFLFEQQEGYCTYYASAMVILLRLNDIPARYVEGYRADLYILEDYMHSHPEDPVMQQAPRSMEVRRSNAHAWVETFLQGYGWVAFEPTSPYRIPADSNGEDREDDGDEETAAAALEDDEQPAGGAGAGNLYLRALLAVGLLLAGFLSRAFFKLSRSGHPEILYYRLIKVRTAFKHLPAPGETPGSVLDQFKIEFPEYLRQFEILKEQYQISFYAGKNKKMKPLSRELAALPLWAALSYRKNLSFLHYARGWLKLFLSITLPQFRAGGTA